MEASTPLVSLRGVAQVYSNSRLAATNPKRISLEAVLFICSASPPHRLDPQGGCHSHISSKVLKRDTVYTLNSHTLGRTPPLFLKPQ